MANPNDVKGYDVYTVCLALREGTSPARAVQILKQWARLHGYSVGRAAINYDGLALYGRTAVIYGEYVKADVPRFREATAEQLLSGELIEGHADWREINLAELRQQGARTHV